MVQYCHNDTDIHEVLLCNKSDVKKTMHFRALQNRILGISVLFRIAVWFLFLGVCVSLRRFGYASRIVFSWPVLYLKCNGTRLLKTVIKYLISQRNPLANWFSGMVTSEVCVWGIQTD